MTPTIAPNPHLGWCPACMESWRPTMIAVSIPTNAGAIRICGDCIQRAAQMVADELAARASDERARRGEV